MITNKLGFEGYTLWQMTGHYIPKEVIKKWRASGFPIVTIVRNPFDRLYTMYSYPFGFGMNNNDP